jgi:myosin heavy subunit
MGKFKIAIISAIIGAVAMAVPWFLQQQTIKDLRQENEDLKQKAAQVASLQAQATQAEQEAANASGGVEAQQHDLARLRAEVSQLRRATNELAKARMEIQKLNQRVSEETEARIGAAAALQAQAQQGSAASKRNACINNLRLIDSAKQQWALENRKQATDTPTMDDLKPYIGHGPNGELPACPDGGVYTIGTVAEKPTCNIPGHVLP